MFTCESAALNRIPKAQGLEKLVRALKLHAASAKNEQFRNYYRSDFGRSLYSVSEMECGVGYYAFYYRRNESSECSCELLKIKPTNLAFIGEADQDDYIDIEGGKDHIIVMRRTVSIGSFGMGMSGSMRGKGAKCGRVGKSGGG